MLLFILGFLLFIIVPVVYLYSLFKPSKFNIQSKKNKDGKWTRLQFSAFASILWLLSVFLMTAGDTTDSTAVVEETKDTDSSEVVEETKDADSSEVVVEDNQPTNTSSAEKEKIIDNSNTRTVPQQEIDKTIQEPTFGITPDEYGNRFMEEANKLGLGQYTWGGVDLQKGAVNDVFTIKLSDALGMTGTVDKNGELKGITYIMGRNDEGDKVAMNMMVLGGITARVLNPDLSEEETAGTVSNLMVKAVDTFTKKGEASESKVIEDVKYSVNIHQTTGIWLSFEPAN